METVRVAAQTPNQPATAEPDFLFVLDMTTGAIVQRVALKSGPEEIVDKDGKLYVRTYDRDYVFALR